jgi:hypothetical protein
MFIRPMNSLLLHWSPFITTNEFIQNWMKSLDLQGHLLLYWISTSNELTSTLKNPPSTGSNENVANCLASTSCWTYCASSLVFFSTCSFPKSLIMMNENVDGVVCLQRSLVSSSPSPTMAKCLNASKISCSTSLFSPKLSLLLGNVGGGLHASGSI